jgi:hypothetical protein
MAEALIEKLRNNLVRIHRLLWLEAISDEYLEKI